MEEDKHTLKPRALDLFVYHQKDARGSYLRLRQFVQFMEALDLSKVPFDTVIVHCTDFADVLKQRPKSRPKLLYKKWTLYQGRANLEADLRPKLLLSMMDDASEMNHLHFHFIKGKGQFDFVLGLSCLSEVKHGVLPAAILDTQDDFPAVLQRLRAILLGEQKLPSEEAAAAAANAAGKKKVPDKEVVTKPQRKSKEEMMEMLKQAALAQLEGAQKQNAEKEIAGDKPVEAEAIRLPEPQPQKSAPPRQKVQPPIPHVEYGKTAAMTDAAPLPATSAPVDKAPITKAVKPASVQVAKSDAKPDIKQAKQKTVPDVTQTATTPIKPAAERKQPAETTAAVVPQKPTPKSEPKRADAPGRQPRKEENAVAVAAPTVSAENEQALLSKLEQKVKELQETLDRQAAIELAMDRELKKVKELQSQYKKLCGNRAGQEVEIYTSPKAYFSMLADYCKLAGISEQEVLGNPKEEFRYFCWRYLAQMRLFPLPEVARHSPEGKEAVLVEFRVLPHLEFLLRNAMMKLGSSWSFTVICGLLNQEYVREICNKLSPRIRVHVIDCENITASTYSLLLASHDFWKMVEGEKVLIYQEDTMIFGKHLDEYMRWDYIGAPWPKDQNDTPNGVGNGGLSLRSKSAMLRVLDKIGIFDTDYNSSTLQYIANSKSTVPPEDVYFSKNLQTYGLGKVAPRELARGFSSETDYNPHSWGAHGVWVDRCAVAGQWKSRILQENLIQLCPTSDKMSFFHRGGWRTVLERLEAVDLLSGTAKIKFLDVLDGHFLWGTNSVIEQPWCGCVHGIVEPAPYAEFSSIRKLFENKNFIKSLSTCKFLFALASNVQQYMRTQLDARGYNNIVVAKLMHPVDSENVIPFGWNLYVNNNDKKLIQIGQQARKITSIQLVDAPNHTKLWLTGTKDFIKLDDFLQREVDTLPVAQVGKPRIVEAICQMRTFVETHEEYDELLSKNIVFLDLYDSAACNVLLECILRNTPIVLNRTEGVQEYLPPDYPLYFESLSEVPSLLVSQKIQEAHRYLCSMDKRKFTMECFVEGFARLCYEEIHNK